MKTKLDFVTNSSSSSFVISLDKINAKQLRLIKNHIKESRIRFPQEFDTDDRDEWLIFESENTVEGSTMMDNFDMEEFLYRIGVDPKNVKWED